MPPKVNTLADPSRWLFVRRKNRRAELFEYLDDLAHRNFEGYSQRDDAADGGSAGQVKALTNGHPNVILDDLQCPRGEQATIPSASKRESLEGLTLGPKHRMLETNSESVNGIQLQE